MISSLNGMGSSAAASRTASEPSFIGNDFNAFLRMLTTQMQNQDPLNPVEGADFAVQLATFSGVEQQAQTNKLLNEMILQLGASGLGQFAEWIGKEARTTEPVWFGENVLTLDITPDGRADSVVLVTLDAAGREVMREDIGAGAGQIDWYGRGVDGTKLPDGRYAFRTESMFQGQVISEETVGAYSQISEAEMHNKEAVLILEGGVRVAAASIDALRKPLGH